MLGRTGQITWAADASSVTGMPITPYMWRMPKAARAWAAMEKPLLPAPSAAFIHDQAFCQTIRDKLQQMQHKHAIAGRRDLLSATMAAIFSHSR